ncbi:protein ROOT INITIATION DEFECTIVE 3-like [Curcuma longa]|uniref:protein ROOT INITIATION DEFECTIVE 3-like n=1 Tax=Curcuma longa TaxID=136217 RepID=UPI003D9F428A
MEVVIASSAVDAGISCWELRSGAERHQYRSCSSAPHGLLSVSGRFSFLAASQLRDAPSATSAPIFFWSWDKPQVEVRSFPAEPIGPLISNAEGTYIIGGGLSGSIYLWEVFTGKLLKKWHAHYRSVNCLTLSKDDEPLLISGSEDGSVKVWSLIILYAISTCLDFGSGGRASVGRVITVEKLFYFHKPNPSEFGSSSSSPATPLEGSSGRSHTASASSTWMHTQVCTPLSLEKPLHCSRPSSRAFLSLYRERLHLHEHSVGAPCGDHGGRAKWMAVTKTAGGYRNRR